MKERRSILPKKEKREKTPVVSSSAARVLESAGLREEVEKKDVPHQSWGGKEERTEDASL